MTFAGQSEVFTRTISPCVQDVLKGFETSIFAYGQTGTGKTHTMEGDISSDDNTGVIPRATAAIFAALEGGGYVEHEVRASYLEI
jgi:hypothetical protein